MPRRKLPPIHPGEILLEEFLVPLAFPNSDPHFREAALSREVKVLPPSARPRT